jgi:hypothetical protein
VAPEIGGGGSRDEGRRCPGLQVVATHTLHSHNTRLGSPESGMRGFRLDRPGMCGQETSRVCGQWHLQVIT